LMPDGSVCFNGRCRMEDQGTAQYGA